MINNKKIIFVYLFNSFIFVVIIMSDNIGIGAIKIIDGLFMGD